MALPNNINAGVFGGVLNATRFCFEYRQILLVATKLNYKLPSPPQQIKQDRLIRQLKISGLWNLLDVLYIFANDGGHQFAQLNWKAPSSFQITEVNSPTFINNVGFDFNSTTQYLNTSWIPSSNGVNYVQNSASVSAHLNENFAGASESNVGTGTSANSLTNSITFLMRNTTDVTVARINDSTNLSLTNTNSIGFYTLQRSASNSKAIFKNGSSMGSSATASTGISNFAVYIGAGNGAGTATRFASTKTSMVAIGGSLLGLESVFYTIWNNYFKFI